MSLPNLPRHQADFRAILCRLIATGSPPAGWENWAEPTWQGFLQAAEVEGVGPLIYWAFKTRGWPEVMPAQVRQALAQNYYQSSARNTLHYQELGGVLAALGDAHIPVVVLKGAALAANLYPQASLRPMNDIDLYVPETQAVAALGALTAIGYQAITLRRGLPLGTTHEVKLWAGVDRQVWIDLHWALFAPGEAQQTPPADWFMQRTIPFEFPPGLEGLPAGSSIPGLQARMLDREALLIFLVYHILRHGLPNARLLWYYDLALLLERDSTVLDWDNLLAQPRQRAALSVVLLAGQPCLQLPLPQSVRAELEQALGELPEGMVQQPKPEQAATRVMQVGASLHNLDTRRRLAVIFSYLFPGPGYMRWRYQPRLKWLLPLYYPYRWLDIIYDGLLTLAKK